MKYLMCAMGALLSNRNLGVFECRFAAITCVLHIHFS